MKFNFPLMIVGMALFIQGCSKSANPVEFSKIERPQSINIENRDTVNDSRTYTLLELYLAEKIDRNYMMKWFFKDAAIYREKLFYIKDEIESKQPLSDHDTNRIIYLENGMNELIQKFNEKNVFKRTMRIAGAALDTRRDKNERNTKYTLGEVKEEGAPAAAISNSTLGYLGSFLKYGFNIELVNFLDR